MLNFSHIRNLYNIRKKGASSIFPTITTSINIFIIEQDYNIKSSEKKNTRTIVGRQHTPLPVSIVAVVHSMRRVQKRSQI